MKEKLFKENRTRLKRFFLFFLIFSLYVPTFAGIYTKPFQNVNIIDDGNFGTVAQTAVSIFRRTVKEQCGSTLSGNGRNCLTIQLKQDKTLPAEAFRIERKNSKTYSVFAASDNGLMYGIGKLLHSSWINSKGLAVGQCVGASKPDKEIRGIYFASHFGNFYHKAPLEEVNRYIEDLALWGCNSLAVWFDMHHYSGIDDPEAVKMLDRLSAFLRTA